MTLDITILALMARSPRHGYDIKKEIEAIMPQEGRLNNNSLYPAIRRLLDQGFLLPAEVSGDSSLRKKYELSESGRQRLMELLRDFGEAEAARENDFLVRVAFFDLLPAQERLRIVELRENALRKKLAHGRALEEAYGGGAGSSWIKSILENRESKLRVDLSWMETLRTPDGEGDRA